MAMIKCPECQSEVSDRASACPRCGFPISSIETSNIVKIKMPSHSDVIASKFRIFDVDTREELLRVEVGGVAELHSQRPLNICITWWNTFGKPDFPKNCCSTVYPGKKYSVSWEHGWLTLGLVCSEVDFF